MENAMQTKLRIFKDLYVKFFGDDFLHEKHRRVSTESNNQAPPPEISP